MKPCSICFIATVFFFISYSWFTTVFAQGFFQEKLTTSCNVRLTITNLGMVGNSFRGSYLDPSLRYPSCEFPAGSGVEHLFNAALWIGAEVGGEKLVSTGSVDDPVGYATGKAGYEFTTSPGNTFIEKSSLLDNPNYSADAVSHQDLICDFTDANTIVPGTQIPISDHRNPLGATIHFESYNWDYDFANFFVILNYKITNTSTNVWNNAYMGFWANPVVRNVNKTPAGTGGTAFFNKGGAGYIDTLTMGYHFDATGDPGFTESYIGFKFLGATLNNECTNYDTAFKVYFNTWNFRDFQSAFRTPNNDQERYARLSTGLNYQEDWLTNLLPQLKRPSNRVQMTSVGPFNSIAPGQSVNIVFAIVLAKKQEDGKPNTDDNEFQRANLTRGAAWAQAAYNGEDQNANCVLDAGEDLNGDGKITRFLLPAPPDQPKTKIITESNSIKVYWSDNAERSIDPISRNMDFEGYKIYKTKVGFELAGANLIQDLKLSASYDKPNNNIGFDNGFNAIRLASPIQFADDSVQYHYMYEFKDVLDGWQHAVAVTAFDSGDPSANLESLESSKLSAARRVFSGKPVNNDFKDGEPFVYPNPYYGSASWEGSLSNAEEDRRIMFANLPKRCEVSVYTAAGDLVYHFKHEGGWGANTTRWNRTYGDPTKSVYSGGEHAWNLLSNDSQIISRGLYVFAVKDLDTGTVKNGKFVVIR